MTEKKTKKKWWIWLLIGIPVLIIVVAVIVALSGVNTFLKPVIKNALAKVVVDGSDSLYTFSLNDYTIGPGGKSVELNGIEIHVDSARYKLLQTAGLLPDLVFSVSVKKASVSGLHPWDLWRNKDIICKSVNLDGADVILLQQEKKENDSDTAKDVSKSLYELIKPDINNISIRRVDISQADVVYKTVGQQVKDSASWHFENSSVVLDDILVDSTTSNDSSRVLYASNMDVSLGSFQMNSSDGIYTFSTKNTTYNFKERSASVEGFKMTPAISQAEFNQRMGHEADLVTISIPQVDVSAFNAGALVRNNSIDAGNIKLNGPDISLYKDKNAGPDNRNKMGKYPHQLLLKAEMPIRIKKLEISNGKLLVTQKSNKTQREGSFKFNDVHGDIENITNDPGAIANDKWCKADLKAGFMGNNPMRAIFRFDLASDNGHFITDANLASLSPGDINNTIKALAVAEFQSFNLDKLEYHVEGYDHFAVGNLTLLYHDLKMSALEKQDDGSMKKKGLISLLANVIKLYNDNPMPGDEVRKATGIREERQVNKNLFGLIVKTLLTCTQEIVVKGKNKQLPGMGGK